VALRPTGHGPSRRDGNPAQFEGYWNDPEKTEQVRVGDWHLTGDIGVRDEDGYVWWHCLVEHLLGRRASI